MSHLDPEQLALLAMGEDVDDTASREHLAGCPSCARELAQLQHAVDVGRASIDIGDLETPSPVVWDRIAEELHLSMREGGVDAEAPPAPPVSRADARAADRTEAAQADPASRASERARPRPRWTRVLFGLAAALALVLVIGAGTLVLVQRNAAVPVAEATLDAFPEHPGAAGTATVERDADGAEVLRVRLDAPRGASGYREVWLITEDASALISLGVLDGDEGTFPVPNGVDLREFVLVDISDEPVDGDPTHSGDSIVRGQLSFA